MSGPQDRPRFAADEMLGSLAKWLRILGYDTTYSKGKDDAEIARVARSEGRVLLTRDKALAIGTSGSIYIESDVLDEQIGQLDQAVGLHFDEKVTRCTICNGELAIVDKESIIDDVPPRSFQMTESFYRCRTCSKVYWKGTHWHKILERIDAFGLQGRSLL